MQVKIKFEFFKNLRSPSVHQRHQTFNLPNRREHHPATGLHKRSPNHQEPPSIYAGAEAAPEADGIRAQIFKQVVP